MPEQPSRTCETCGGTFTRVAGSHEPHAKFMARRFCSAECSRNRPLATLRERFEDKVTHDDDGCWRWHGARAQGYGIIATGTRADGNLPAHVAAYELHVGPVPDGMVLDHLCRNRECVNPEHLEPVTSAENSRRGAKAKITPADAEIIRGLVAEGKTQAAVADRFGLHPATVSRIVNHRRWAGPEHDRRITRTRSSQARNQ